MGVIKNRLMFLILGIGIGALVALVTGRKESLPDSGSGGVDFSVATEAPGVRAIAKSEAGQFAALYDEIMNGDFADDGHPEQLSAVLTEWAKTAPEAAIDHLGK
jgi:hypothetical protein